MVRSAYRYFAPAPPPSDKTRVRILQAPKVQEPKQTNELFCGPGTSAAARGASAYSIPLCKKHLHTARHTTFGLAIVESCWDNGHHTIQAVEILSMKDIFHWTNHFPSPSMAAASSNQDEDPTTRHEPFPSTPHKRKSPFRIHPAPNKTMTSRIKFSVLDKLH